MLFQNKHENNMKTRSEAAVFYQHKNYLKFIAISLIFHVFRSLTNLRTCSVNFYNLHFYYNIPKICIYMQLNIKLNVFVKFEVW